jgi:arginine repressor
MILWRHLDDKKEFWVYHATKADADRELERLSIVNCANASSRMFYCRQRRLDRVDVVEPDNKRSMAKLMNRVERKEEIQWLK